MSIRMTVEEFRELVDGYGADPDRWPDDVRGAAERLAASSPDARQILAAEAGLDALLIAGAQSVSPALRERLLAIPQAEQQERKKRRRHILGLPIGFLAPRFAGALAAGVLGFMIGFNGLFAELYPAPEAGTETVDLSAMIYGLDVEEVSL